MTPDSHFIKLRIYIEMWSHHIPSNNMADTWAFLFFSILQCFENHESSFIISHCLSDPFADADKGPGEAVQDGLVHIRIQQRNGRKTLTTIQGLSAEYDLKKIVRHCKKVQLTTDY